MQIVKRIPLRARIRLETFFAKQNGKTYGPYTRWRATWNDQGKERYAYIRDEDRARIELAHEMVRAEIEAAERAAQTPQLQRLRELQQLAGVKRAELLPLKLRRGPK